MYTREFHPSSRPFVEIGFTSPDTCSVFLIGLILYLYFELCFFVVYRSLLLEDVLARILLYNNT
jgi:hypothetical protein